MAAGTANRLTNGSAAIGWMRRRMRQAPSRRAIGLAAASLGTAFVCAAILAGALWHWRDWPPDPTAPRAAKPSVTAVAPSPSTPPSPVPPSVSPPASSAASPPASSPGSPPAAPSQPASPPPAAGAPFAAPQSLAAIIADLRRDAATGDPMAQHDLALAYVTGRGVTQDYKIAAGWFEKATEHGLERAQYNLAVLYENGLGVARDQDRARELYAAAAEQGFALAQHNLGVIYAEGRGVARDFRAAALWFRRAADQGIASAQFNLGMIHERGLAGPADERTAYGLYRQAAAGGSEAAVARLAVLEGRIAPSDDGTGGGQKLTRAETAEIQRMLAQLAFEPGPADGLAGPATRAAIRGYQQVAGLPVDGEPSAALLAHLRQVVGMMARP